MNLKSTLMEAWDSLDNSRKCLTAQIGSRLPDLAESDDTDKPVIQQSVSFWNHNELLRNPIGLNEGLENILNAIREYDAGASELDNLKLVLTLSITHRKRLKCEYGFETKRFMKDCQLLEDWMHNRHETTRAFVTDKTYKLAWPSEYSGLGFLNLNYGIQKPFWKQRKGAIMNDRRPFSLDAIATYDSTKGKYSSEVENLYQIAYDVLFLEYPRDFNDIEHLDEMVAEVESSFWFSSANGPEIKTTVCPSNARKVFIDFDENLAFNHDEEYDSDIYDKFIDPRYIPDMARLSEHLRQIQFLSDQCWTVMQCHLNTLADDQKIVISDTEVWHAIHVWKGSRLLVTPSLYPPMVESLTEVQVDKRDYNDYPEKSLLHTFSHSSLFHEIYHHQRINSLSDLAEVDRITLTIKGEFQRWFDIESGFSAGRLNTLCQDWTGWMQDCLAKEAGVLGDWLQDRNLISTRHCYGQLTFSLNESSPEYVEDSDNHLLNEYMVKISLDRSLVRCKGSLPGFLKPAEEANELYLALATQLFHGRNQAKPIMDVTGINIDCWATYCIEIPADLTTRCSK